MKSLIRFAMSCELLVHTHLVFVFISNSDIDLLHNC